MFTVEMVVVAWFKKHCIWTSLRTRDISESRVRHILATNNESLDSVSSRQRGSWQFKRTMPKFVSTMVSATLNAYGSAMLIDTYTSCLSPFVNTWDSL